VNFQKKIENFIAEHQLFDKQKPVIAAVSGGLDSVALLNFLVENNYKCAIAHCNFHLRGEASNLDAVFVQKLAEKYSIPLYINEFDTVYIAKRNGTSIEMTARNLRYEWFDKLFQDGDFQAIAVAHHQNDNAETIFLNIIRGTGIRGLAGIYPKREKIVRPFLCVTRSEIRDYAEKKGLQWREDLSNSDTNFKRNHIRHNILPEMEKQNPSLVLSLSKFSENIYDAITLYNSAIDNFSKQIMSKNGDIFSLDIKTLLNSPASKTLLFEILQKFDFQTDIIDEIFKNINSQSGKKYFSKNYQIIKDREKLLISKNKITKNQDFIIEKDTKLIEKPLKLSFEIVKKESVKSLKVNKNTALFDYDTIKFPLTLRTWQAGDYFQPFGFFGKQKISDFFVNQRFSLLDKQKTFLLISENKIIWIVNHRTDERFKITAKTKKILIVKSQ
jgi:tRNA(Ile)-lysidine synthase